jgi:hypothetical protein
MLKKKLTKAEYDALTAEMKKLYKQDGDDYVLDVEGGFEDTGALKRAKQHEVDQHNATKAKLTTAESTLTTVQEELNTLKAKGPKDIRDLESSYQDKLRTEKEAGNARVKKAHDQVIMAQAKVIATEISTVPALMAREIAARLTVDDDGVVRVVDKSGALSATTLDELKKEFLTNKDFAGIIKVSKASGSGAAGKAGAEGNGSAGTITVEKFRAMGDKERRELFESDPDTFRTLSAAAKRRD